MRSRVLKKSRVLKNKISRKVRNKGIKRNKPKRSRKRTAFKMATWSIADDMTGSIKCRKETSPKSKSQCIQAEKNDRVLTLGNELSKELDLPSVVGAWWLQDYDPIILDKAKRKYRRCRDASYKKFLAAEEAWKIAKQQWEPYKDVAEIRFNKRDLSNSGKANFKGNKCEKECLKRAVSQKKKISKLTTRARKLYNPLPYSRTEIKQKNSMAAKQESTGKRSKRLSRKKSRKIG